MQLAEGLTGLKAIQPSAVISVGNFDGLHRGHAAILEKAKSLRTTDGGDLVCVTFEPHPLTVLAPDRAPPRLTPPNLKRELLAAAGVDRLIELPPSQEVLNLTAQDFWTVLRDHVRPRHMVEGTSFNFGKGRAGNIHKLGEWAAASRITLHVVPPVEAALLDFTIAPVSSSLIRWLLANGRARDAAICLGRPYTFEGKVIKGHGRGKALGVPTANLDATSASPAGQMVPMEGVYAARSTIDATTYPAALSIGRMETFGQNQKVQVEAHLIGFSGDLYNRTVRIELVDWLRPQQKFSAVPELKAKIARDIDQTKEKAQMQPARPIARAH
jgi:riboflavin kinase/FMN adenylyltransferase